MLDCDPWDDLGNWPADADKYKGMQLSNTKMRNEINNREPRKQDEQDGISHPYPIVSTSTGWHSTNKDFRKSDIEDLGEGTCLYFKFLKYFMVLLLTWILISIPATIIYSSGTEYSYATDNRSEILKSLLMYMATPTLGNLGSYMVQSCNSAQIP